MRLANKTVLITAAGQGIGRATAELFAREGARVIATDVNEAALYDVAGCETRRLDVLDPAAIQALADELGAIDVLFNCAGVVHAGTILQCDETDWRMAFALNVDAQHHTIRAFLPAMLRAGGGSIINMSSIQAMRGTPGNHGYVASKWAIRGLTKSAALELATNNIRVNSLHPGMIRTPMTAHMPDDLVAAPMGRLGEPYEVSTFVLFLASDEASYATGSEFVMDGGLITDVPHRMS